MLITRRSRRRSEVFRSRFDEAGQEFPLRQYMRCREDVASSIVHAVLLAGFAVALVLFGRVLWRVFSVHGGDLSPWYQRFSALGVGIMILFVLRRLWGRVQNAREARDEMRALQARLRALGEDAPRDDGPPAPGD